MNVRPSSLPVGLVNLRILVVSALLVVGVVLLNRYNYASKAPRTSEMGVEQRGEVRMSKALISTSVISLRKPLIDEEKIRGDNNASSDSANPSDASETVKGYTVAEYFKNTKTTSQVADAAKLVAHLRPNGADEFAEMIGVLVNIEKLVVQSLDGRQGQVSKTIKNMSFGKFKSEMHTISAFFNDSLQVPVNVNVSAVDESDVHVRYARDGAVSVFVINNQSAGTECSFEFYASGSIRSFVYTRMNPEKTGLERSLDFMISEVGELVRNDADP
jgi:hypothetical protein